MRTVRLCLQCLTAEDHQSHENVRHNFNKLLFVNKYDGNVNFTHGLGPPTRMSAPAAPSPTAYSGSVCLRFHLPNIPTANCATISPIKEMLHGTIFNATLLREKSIPCNMTINLLQQRCRYLKSVQSCATRCGNKCCVKNRLQTPCYTYRFFVQQCCVKNCR